MTDVVIDANICLALFLPLPYSREVEIKIRHWVRIKTGMLAPTLWEYEVVSGLRRAEYQKIISHENAQLALSTVKHLHVEVYPPTFRVHQQALDFSRRLGQSKCYDAQYLALARESGVEFWTADQRLVHQCQGIGIDWVHWIGDKNG